MFFLACILLIAFIPISPLTAEDSIAEDIALSDLLFRTKVLGMPVVDLLVLAILLLALFVILALKKSRLPFALLLNPVSLLMIFAAILGLAHTYFVYPPLKNTLYDFKVVMYYLTGLFLGYGYLCYAIRRGKSLASALLHVAILVVLSDSLGRIFQFIIYLVSEKLLVLIALAGFPVVSPFSEPYNSLAFLPVSPLLFAVSIMLVLFGSALSLSLGSTIPFLLILVIRPWRSIFALRLLLPSLLLLNFAQAIAMQQVYNHCTTSSNDYSGISSVCLKTTGIETRISQFDALLSYQNNYWLSPVIGLGLGQTYIDENDYSDDPFAQGTSVSDFGEYSDRKFIVHTSLANQVLKFGLLPILISFYAIDRLIVRIASTMQGRFAVTEMSLLSLFLLWYTSPIFYFGSPKSAFLSGLASALLYLFAQHRKSSANEPMAG